MLEEPTCIFDFGVESFEVVLGSEWLPFAVSRRYLHNQYSEQIFEKMESCVHHCQVFVLHIFSFIEEGPGPSTVPHTLTWCYIGTCWSLCARVYPIQADKGPNRVVHTGSNS